MTKTMTNLSVATPKKVKWPKPKGPFTIIEDDGEKLESNRHRVAINALIRSVKYALRHRQDYFVGGNMFIYFSEDQLKNKDYRGPDFFFVRDVDGTFSREVWVVWEEDDRLPNVIIELMSASTAQFDQTQKKTIYEQDFETEEYYVFDPFDPNSLAGWRLNSLGRYRDIDTNDQGWLWCEGLGFWLGTWLGTIEGEQAEWLRFYYPDGSLVPLPEEAEHEQAELERQRNELERQLAELERQRASIERERAKRADQRAKRADQRAKQEAKQAKRMAKQAEWERERANAMQAELELERQRANLLAERLRLLGENPD